MASSYSLANNIIYTVYNICRKLWVNWVMEKTQPVFVPRCINTSIGYLNVFPYIGQLLIGASDYILFSNYHNKALFEQGSWVVWKAPLKKKRLKKILIILKYSSKDINPRLIKMQRAKTGQCDSFPNVALCNCMCLREFHYKKPLSSKPQQNNW